MATDKDGPEENRQKLRLTLEENQRLVQRTRALASALDEGMAAVKDLKAKARQQQTPRHPNRLPLSGPAAPFHRILLVEDHPIVSLGISELINYESDLKVSGCADERLSALQQLERLKPDLVILDLCLRDRSGLDLLKEIRTRFPRQRVLILSLQDESVYAPRALRAGACGYVMKEEATETLLRAIRAVLAGGTYLSPAMQAQTQQASDPSAVAAHEPLQGLTDRELEVFQLIGQGRPTRDIAHMLCISLKTVETHRTNIKHKLELHTATDLVRLAIESEHNPRHTVRCPSA